MPDTYNDRAITQAAPARISSANAAVNDSPSAKGKPAGGLENLRANYETYNESDSRPQASSPTRSVVQHFDDAEV